MSKTAKWLFALLSAAVFLILLACIVFPTHYDITVQGTEITKNGQTVCSVTVSLDGWYLHRQFSADEISVNLQVESTEDPIASFFSSVADLGETVRYTTGWYYSQNSAPLLLAFDPDMERFLIELPEKGIYYVASTDPNITPEMLYQYFRPFIDR